MAIPVLTEERLKELALDIVKDKIFLSDYLTPSEASSLLNVIFMPLLFFDQKQIDEMKEDNIATFYGYYSDAGPRAINGFPQFMSFGMLTEEQRVKVFNYCDKYREVLGAV